MLATILSWTKKHRAGIFALAVIVVFCTTYALILPALTLDEETAVQQGGIDVAVSGQSSIEEEFGAAADDGAMVSSDAQETAAGTISGRLATASDTISGMRALSAAAPSGTPTYTYDSQTGSIMSASAVTGLIGSDNQWQIVNGIYENNAAANKNASTNGKVRVQKNVIPTDTENEFLMYLSVDINRESIVQEIFDSVGIVHTPSNNVPEYGGVWTGGDAVKADNCWDTGKKDGNMRPFTVNKVGDTRYTWTLNITAGGKTYTITRYAEDGSFNQGHILMKIGGKWMTVGNAAKTNGKATVMNISIDDGAFKTLLSQVTNVDIGTVVDTMGPGITATEIVSYKPTGGDNAATISADGKTINWKMVASTMGYTSDGWYPNIAELVYKIKYDPSVSTGLKSGTQTVADYAAANVNTNSSAVLTYKVTTSSGSSTATQDFPKPVIRGMLYEIKGTKTGSDTKAGLAGATFTLYSDKACTNAVGTCTTTSDGTFDFANLQYGTYYLRETAAPSGYHKADDMTIRLCYTDSSTVLTGQGSGEEALYQPGNEAFTITDQKNIITVTKTVVAEDPLAVTDVSHTIYIALWDRTNNQYLKDANGNIRYKTIAITNGEPSPSSVTFEGIDTGIYDVMELSAVDGTSYTELAAGNRFTNAGGKMFQVKSITSTATYADPDSGAATDHQSDNDANLTYSNTATVAFTNTYCPPTTTTFIANKKWADAAGKELAAPDGATVTYTLYRQTSGGSIEPATDTNGESMVVTLDGAIDTDSSGATKAAGTGELSAWTANFADLPVADGSGNKYIYKVRETACSNSDYAAYATQNSTSPMGDSDYLTSSGGTIWNKQKTISITFKKEDNNNKFLPGASFKLYSISEDSAGSHDTLVNTGFQDSTALESDGEFTISTENGVTVNGLTSGTYKLTETKAPDGYVLTNPSVVFTVNATGTGAVIAWSGSKPENAKDLSNTTNTGDTITIINTPGVELPNTGGPGTGLFYFIGITLVGLAGTGLLMKRRKKAA